MERESMQYDVVIVGAGPAGLASAIRLRQLAIDSNHELSVCVLEKASEIGAHILSGAVIEPRAMDELLPDWQAQGAPLHTPVSTDHVYFLTGPDSSIKTPGFLVPASMHNKGNYVVSLANVCRWLAEQAEGLGVDIFPGFAAAELLYNEAGSIKGVVTGDMGISATGEHKDSYEPGMALLGKYTVFAEGCRGHLGKQLIEKFDLATDVDPPHFGLGIKELWQIEADRHQPGLVVHGAGWPLTGGASGGSFLYHQEHNQVAVGLIIDLNYANPYLSPYDEFQRLKHHPLISTTLQGGKRIAYGARAISKGGLNSLPKMSFPGGLLIGCDAGTLNFAKIKGSHTAMKCGMVAAETLFESLAEGDEGGTDLLKFNEDFRASWAYDELYRSRNFGPALHKFGLFGGAVFNYIDQTIFRGKLPITLHDRQADHKTLKPAAECEQIEYAKADGVLSFDKLSSVFISNTNHAEDQVCHLKLLDESVPVQVNLRDYAAPEQRYCPAGVYEIIEQAGKPHLQINAQNCLHCKACDIKDPGQNINWLAPEGGGGPNYPNM